MSIACCVFRFVLRKQIVIQSKKKKKLNEIEILQTIYI